MIMSGKDDSHQKVSSKGEDDKRAIEHSDHTENTQRTHREYTENNQTTLSEHSPTPLETRGLPWGRGPLGGVWKALLKMTTGRKGGWEEERGYDGRSPISLFFTVHLWP